LGSGLVSGLVVRLFGALASMAALGDGIVLDKLLLASFCWLNELFRLCPSSSQPLLPKLPLRISPSVGAFAAASPVAAHYMTGKISK
jgi:hypothetical protein